MNQQRIFTALGVAAATVALLPSASATLASYDAAIAADHAGGLPYIEISTTSATFDGTNSAPFDFGANSGAVTMEFIVSGDPVAGGRGRLFGSWRKRHIQPALRAMG